MNMNEKNAFVTVDVVGSANFENMCNEYKSQGYVLSSSSSCILSESFPFQVKYVAIFVLPEALNMGNRNENIKKIDVKLEVGKRYLISETIDDKLSTVELFAAFLDEVSPSGKYIKLRYKISNVSAVDGWYLVDSIIIMEKLFDE